MNWMVRFSNNGVAYDGFKWNPIGEWTEAPDWNPEPVCGGGLHGQGMGGWGYCQPGSRFEICEIEDYVLVNSDKIKTKRAKILAVDKQAWELLLKRTRDGFKGSLNLGSYSHPLPAGLTHCGGDLYLGSYSHPLPAGFTLRGGFLDLGSYSHPLPAGFIYKKRL